MKDKEYAYQTVKQPGSDMEMLFNLPIEFFDRQSMIPHFRRKPCLINSLLKTDSTRLPDVKESAGSRFPHSEIINRIGFVMQLAACYSDRHITRLNARHFFVERTLWE